MKWISKTDAIRRADKYAIRDLKVPGILLNGNHQLIDEWKGLGYRHIALITRSNAEARRLRRQFPDAFLMDDEEDVLREGVTLCACHTTKGLEFDAVCVIWPDAGSQKDEMRRLYTACSRALHALAVCRTE